MTARFPTEAKEITVLGLVHSVRFLGTIPHGKNKRQIAMDVHPDLIVKIAAALIATKNCACDSEWQLAHRGLHD